MYDSVQPHSPACLEQSPVASGQPDTSNPRSDALNWWQQPLVREIALILVVKIALIFALWWFFFDLPDNQRINASQVGTHLVGTEPAAVHPSEEKP